MYQKVYYGQLTPFSLVWKWAPLRPVMRVAAIQEVIPYWHLTVTLSSLSRFFPPQPRIAVTGISQRPRESRVSQLTTTSKKAGSVCAAQWRPSALAGRKYRACAKSHWKNARYQEASSPWRFIFTSSSVVRRRQAISQEFGNRLSVCIYWDRVVWSFSLTQMEGGWMDVLKQRYDQCVS